MPSRESEVASQYEDRILETLKKVGAHVDSAVGAFSNLSHLGDRATLSPVIYIANAGRPDTAIIDTHPP